MQKKDTFVGELIRDKHSGTVTGQKETVLYIQKNRIKEDYLTEPTCVEKTREFDQNILCHLMNGNNKKVVHIASQLDQNNGHFS